MAFHYLAIEGPIGVGKTRLAERLAHKLEATTILEDAENPFLADFYADRPGAALQAQLFYLLNRHRQLTGKRQADLFLQTTICDYVFDKDKIFAYLNLDDNELFIYQRLFDLLARDVPPPDLVIYLQSPTDLLMKRLADLLGGPGVSYGKGAVVGLAGEMEHGAACVHPKLGKPMRAALGGGEAIIPSVTKVAAAGAAIDVPLANKDNSWSFDELDSMTVSLADAPRPNEILVVMAIGAAGRPNPRVGKGRAVT